jgi:glycosyltransferase involved in cell wall biosynthesis
MANVYLVVPDLEYRGHAKQLSLVAPALRQAGHTVGVYALDASGPFADLIRAGGVAVEHSSARDLRSWLLLRWMIPRPDSGVVHAFGLKVLRRLWVATLGRKRPEIVLSLSGRERLSRFDHRCLCAVSRLLVPHAAAAEALARQGVPSGMVTIIPPAVADTSPPPDRDEFCRTNGLPSDARLIMTAGRMETALTLFPPIWAFEFYRYMDPSVRLLVIGDGPGRAETEARARQVAPDCSRVHFLGARADISSILGLADAVLISQPSGAANIALEAMAAGRAVVAADTPDLAAIVRSGVTGILTPAGDAPGMAHALRRLLGDPDRRQLGDAARQFVHDNHAVAAVIQTLETIYSN